MSYEPGSPECRVLINSKEQLETMLLNLAKPEGTEQVVLQVDAKTARARPSWLKGQKKSGHA